MVVGGVPTRATKRSWRVLPFRFSFRLFVSVSEKGNQKLAFAKMFHHHDTSPPRGQMAGKYLCSGAPIYAGVLLLVVYTAPMSYLTLRLEL